MHIEAYKDRESILDHCGIVAAYSSVDVPFFQTGLRGLALLQTRGFDGAGFWAIDRQGTPYHYKGTGMIDEVFTPEILRLYGQIHAHTWVYQVRYGTSGGFEKSNIQPIALTHAKTGDAFVVAHNGQFSKSTDEAEEQSDTYRFANEIRDAESTRWDDFIVSILSQKKGAWSLVIGTQKALYLARDSWGFRPLVYGHIWKKEVQGYMWGVASETSSLETMGAEDCLELMPGTIAKITTSGLTILYQQKSKKRALCIFENVYIHHGTGKAFLPRVSPRAIKHSPTVDDLRRRMGIMLARESPLSLHEADMVIGIPGTGIEGGMQFARALNLPYVQAITDKSNSFREQRTFMTATIETIYQNVLNHFSFDRQTLAGRQVVLVDDSIVRGNITKGLVFLLKTQYGVKNVHLRILCPPIDKLCHLGVNTRSTDELIAARHKGNVFEIKEELGADSLSFLSTAGLRDAIAGDPHARGFCMGCMAGQRHPIDAYGNNTVSQAKQEGNGQSRIEHPRRVPKHTYIHAYA